MSETTPCVQRNNIHHNCLGSRPSCQVSCPEAHSSVLPAAVPGPGSASFPPTLPNSKTERVNLYSCLFWGDASRTSAPLAPSFCEGGSSQKGNVPSFLFCPAWPGWFEDYLWFLLWVPATKQLISWLSFLNSFLKKPPVLRVRVSVATVNAFWRPYAENVLKDDPDCIWKTKEMFPKYIYILFLELILIIQYISIYNKN